MANLEKQFYFQDIEIKALRKENTELIEKIKSFEANLNELRVSFIIINFGKKI